jgi:preprotein translocase subunit SecE
VRLAKAQLARRRSNPIARLARETTAELRKVSWPTRREAVQLTLIVLAVVIVSSALLGFLDFLIARVIGLIIALG